jgi:heme exporter protein D
VDRLEHIVVLAALILAFAALPLAIGVGTTVNQHRQLLSVVETAESTQDTATLLVTVPLSMQLSGAASIVRAPARWRTPAGVTRVGNVLVTPGSVAGQPITIWLDRAGDQIDQPLTADQAWRQGVLAGLGTMAAVAALLALIVLIVRRRLDRVRLAGWAAEWRRVEPRWTQRQN